MSSSLSMATVVAANSIAKMSTLRPDRGRDGKLTHYKRPLPFFPSCFLAMVTEHSDGTKLQVDFGHDETALVELWQVIEN